MSDSPGLADFAIGLVNPVLNRSIFGGNSNYRRTVMGDSRKYPYHTTNKLLIPGADILKRTYISIRW